MSSQAKHPPALTPREGSSAAGPPVQRRPRRRRLGFLEPKGQIARRTYLAIAAAAFGLIAIAWCVATYGGFTKPFFLPAPTDVARAAVRLFTEFGLLTDMRDSFYRVGMGFLISVALAVPLGILMGTFKQVEAFVEPVNDFIRYMPVPAFIPLLILWVGIGNSSQISLIFIGTFFQLVILVSDATAHCPKEYLEVSYTVGASRLAVLHRVILPYTMPMVFDNVRVAFGWAWSYLLLAEIVGANTGLGHMIMESQRFLRTDNVIAGVLIIGVIGLIIDFTFKGAYRVLFRWTEK